MSHRRCSSLAFATALLGASLLASSLCAQGPLPTVLWPGTTFAVQDSPPDGFGDSLSTNAGLIRLQNTREERAIAKFDLRGINIAAISSVTLDARIVVNNAFNNGTRSFDFALFRTANSRSISDFEVPATVVTSGSYAPPTQSSFAVSVDVTALVRSLAMTGAFQDWIGLRVNATTNPNFPNVLDATMTTLTIVESPASSVDLGGGCGVGPVAPVLSSSLPLLGFPFRFDVSGALPNRPLWLYVAFAPPAAIGLAGSCVAHVDPLTGLLLNPGATDATGAYTLAFPLGNDPALLGIDITAQAVVLGAGPPFGIELTNGLSLTPGF